MQQVACVMLPLVGGGGARPGGGAMRVSLLRGMGRRVDPDATLGAFDRPRHLRHAHAHILHNILVPLSPSTDLHEYTKP